MFEQLYNIDDLEFKIKDVHKLDISKFENFLEDENDYEWCGELHNIKDLLKLYDELKDKTDIRNSNIDVMKLINIIPALKDLDNMIGINDIKDNIFNHIIFYLQNLDDEMRDMHHTVIKGPPGVGKTKLTHILANIYKGLGILKEGKVITIKREDFIAEYVGQTGIKTQKKLKEALGNVLLIDEAYSLGNSERKDSFAQQAMDQLNWFLSEHQNEFICIIAGYKEELEQRFFNMNPGLARRFPIHYTIEGYSPEELIEIFRTIINGAGWKLNISQEKLLNFFENNKENFPNYGGDLNNLFSHIKKYHCKRILLIDQFKKLKQQRKRINYDDIKGGYDIYSKTNGYSIDKEDKYYMESMYS